jgi:ubiquitin fusion degradation protein 1
LTKGDTIIINYLSKNYLIDILEVGQKDPNDCNAISIVETDVRVEFEKPLDMVDEEEEEKVEFVETPISEPKTPTTMSPTPNSVKNSEKDTFQVFQGSGRRIDGKAPKKPKKFEIFEF